MRADHVFKVLDIHAGGAPSRLIFSGVPRLHGQSMMEKMQDFAAHHDWIRPALVLEPRGGALTSGIVLTEPTTSEAHVGAFFMEAHGYLPMCGSDTIATTTALVETGQVPITGPETPVRIDTPAGLIEATAHVEDGHVTSVTFVGAPAFCAHSEQRIDVPGFGSVVVDVSYGGNFYVIADARQFGLELEASGTAPAVAVADRLLRAVNEALPVTHPTIREIIGVTHVQLFVPPVDDRDTATQIMVILPTGNVDRSPCGTGTTAKVATLVARGELGLGEPFTHRSVTGARFTGRAVERTTIGTTSACRVAISGTAYVVADSTIYVDRQDELAGGFLIS